MNMSLFTKYKVLAVTAGILLISSCKNYLDVIPDNIPTVDHAFNNRHQAEGFLYGCYAFLPSFSNPATNPALLGDRKSVVKGTGVSVRVDLGGRRIIKKKSVKEKPV